MYNVLMIYKIYLKDGIVREVDEKLYSLIADAMMFPDKYPELKDKVNKIREMDWVEAPKDYHYQQFLKLKERAISGTKVQKAH